MHTCRRKTRHIKRNDEEANRRQQETNKSTSLIGWVKGMGGKKGGWIKQTSKE